MSIENEPPVGQHEWDKGFYGVRGRCSRCGEDGSLAALDIYIRRRMRECRELAEATGPAEAI